MVTQFICLKRGAYQRLVRTDTRLLGNNAVEYLMGLYFFRDWTREQLVYISDNLRKVHYKPGVCKLGMLSQDIDNCSCCRTILSNQDWNAMGLFLL